MVPLILRAEGLLIFISAVYTYGFFIGNWPIFFLLFLTPDFSMIGYLKNKQFGAFTYNVIHNYIVAMGFLFVGMTIRNTTYLSLGLILLAHIGLDRFLGLGLKYPKSFKDTHLQRV